MDFRSPRGSWWFCSRGRMMHHMFCTNFLAEFFFGGACQCQLNFGVRQIACQTHFLSWTFRYGFVRAGSILRAVQARTLHFQGRNMFARCFVHVFQYVLAPNASSGGPSPIFHGPQRIQVLTLKVPNCKGSKTRCIDWIKGHGHGHGHSSFGARLCGGPNCSQWEDGGEAWRFDLAGKPALCRESSIQRCDLGLVVWHPGTWRGLWLHMDNHNGLLFWQSWCRQRAPHVPEISRGHFHQRPGGNGDVRVSS